MDEDADTETKDIFQEFETPDLEKMLRFMGYELEIESPAE